MEILETEALTRRFGLFTAVDSLSIRVTSGEVFGLLGPNGAGKTTTIKMLITLLPPTSGTAHVAGFDIQREAAAVRRSIGYVPQLLSSDGTLSGYENLLVFARLYDIPRQEVRRRVEDALELMDLGDVAGKLVRTYSGGMIRRLEIAQSMLHQPPILFLDEPTVGLDPLARTTVWKHIAQLKQEMGTTLLLTTHYMDEADQLCGRMAIMHLGKVAAIGTPDELKASVTANLADRGEPSTDEVTLDDVFAYYSGGADLDSGGSYRETSRTRRTARRLG